MPLNTLTIMMDDLEAKLEDSFLQFRLKAQEVAVKLNCSVGARSFDVCYAEPVFVSGKEDAVTRAISLMDSVALTGELTSGIRNFKDIKNGSYIGRVGFDERGTPKICLLRGIAAVNSVDGFLGYMSIVAGYELKPNGQAIHDKSSGS